MNAISTPHHRKFPRRVAFAVIVTVSLVGCSRPGTSATPTNPTGSSGSVTTTTTAVAQVTASPRGPSAADQLADFFAAAQRMDDQLRATATLVNTGIGAQAMTFTAPMVDAINAIDPQSLVATIPAGLPGRLQDQVYLLFSELASRRYSFTPVLEAEPGQPLARDSQDGKRVLEGLSHGTEPAARFAADLDAAQALARSEPPLAVAAPDSRAGAEVAVRAAYILVKNRGCASSGGWIQTTAAPITWQQGDNGAGQRTDGTIGGITFRADYQPGCGWQATLNVC